jgi:hypothetical protein
VKLDPDTEAKVLAAAEPSTAMSDRPIIVAYADPPYLGCASYYDHPDAAVYDTLDGHRALIERLNVEFPDGWAMSASSPSLRDLLPLCPVDCRVAAWVKPFAVFKPNVNPAFAWEPVIWRRGRRRGRGLPTVRDWFACNITLRRGLTGAKPHKFCLWLFDLLGLRPGDTLVDLFPGSGAVGRAWEVFRQGRQLELWSGGEP